MEHHFELLSRLLGGVWFSTRREGQCATGAALGTDGCTWRLVREQRAVEEYCVNEHVLGAVEQAAEAHVLECGGAAAGGRSRSSSSSSSSRCSSSASTSCFAACPLVTNSTGRRTPAYNRSTDCYIDCFYDALGAGGGASIVSKSELVDAWNAAFGPEAQGGCPQANVSFGQLNDNLALQVKRHTARTTLGKN